MSSNIHLSLLGLETIRMERLLTVSEAAQGLGGISKYTIQAWLSKYARRCKTRPQCAA
jgi:hypothetical protein